MSTIEAWIVERYGKITFAELGMEPLVVYSAAVAIFSGIEIRGGTLVQFRNKFMETCAVAMFGRLNPPTAAEKAEVSNWVDTQSARRRKCKPKRLTKLQHERNVISMQASRAGYDAAQKIQLSTDVVGGRSSKPALIDQVDPEKWKCPECGRRTESAFSRCDDCV